MTVKFHSNIGDLWIGEGLYYGLAPIGGAVAISVYSGPQPTAAQITANWSTYNSTNSIFLAHYIGAVFYQSGKILQLSTIPAAVNANNTGTGEWCIIWATNVSAVTAAGATLPNAAFIVGPVSDPFGSGIVRFLNTSFTSGVSKAMDTASIGATPF